VEDFENYLIFIELPENVWKFSASSMARWTSRKRYGNRNRTQPMLNKFGQMQQMMKRGQFSKMMARMGGGMPGMLRR